jgi:hypothetical protein
MQRLLYSQKNVTCQQSDRIFPPFYSIATLSSRLVRHSRSQLERYGIVRKTFCQPNPHMILIVSHLDPPWLLQIRKAGNLSLVLTF